MRKISEFESIGCTVCQSKKYTELLKDAVDRMHGISGKFRYVRCKMCGNIWLNPRPDEESIKKFYPPDYGPHTLKGNTSAKNGLKPFAVSPVTRTEAFLKKILNNKSKILDVGCGRGDSLASLRRSFGCRCYGIDFCLNAVENAKKAHELEVFFGRLHEAPYKDGTFDLITMWWYLEHDPDPVSALTKCRNLLKEDGWLIFGVPNYRSFNAKIFRKRWYHLDAPRHLSIFSPRAIHVLMDKTGYKIHKFDWDRSTWGLLGSLQYVISGQDYDVPIRISESRVCQVFSLPATILLSLLKLSDTVTVYCRKK